MKKFTLFSVCLATMASAFAGNYEEVFYDEYLTALSPDGRFAAGAIDDGSVVIRNLESEDEFPYFYDERAGISYYIGTGGSPISNTGIVTGSTNGNNAAYWEKGEWKELKTIYPEFMSNATSITPDGSVICGGVGMDQLSVDAENTMLVPAVWYRQADGTYGAPVLLPHPELDFTGRVPQYITAVAISDDGNTVAGQIRDYTGFMHEPILYTRDASGEWSYTLLYPELINPLNIEFPQYPGEYEGSPMPTQEWFMTEEELADFLEAWENATDTYPTYEEFMTKDEIRQYQEAYEAYLEEFTPWETAYENFFNAYSRVLDEGYSFLFNNVYLTPDGKYYATSREITVSEDQFTHYEVRYPVVLSTDGSGKFDLNGAFPELSILTSSVSADGLVLATSIDPEGIIPNRAYVFEIPEGNDYYPAEGAEPTPLEDFIAGIDPDVADWMEEEMYREVITGVTPSGQFIFGDRMCSGTPVTTPDMSRIICYTSTDLWVEPEAYYYSWIFNTGIEPSGVGTIAGEDALIRVLGGGLLELEGEFSVINIYDMTGAQVFRTVNPQNVVSTGLHGGAYVIRALSADGTPVTLKAVF